MDNNSALHFVCFNSYSKKCPTKPQLNSLNI